MEINSCLAMMVSEIVSKEIGLENCGIGTTTFEGTHCIREHTRRGLGVGGSIGFSPFLNFVPQLISLAAQ